MRLRPAALAVALAVLAPTLSAAAGEQDRLPTIPPQVYTLEQRQAADAFAQARGKPPFGPFEPLMHSPEVMTLARAMGDYLRFKPKIGTTLSESVILLTARRWTQDYEWYVHAPIAEKAGIAPEIIAAIRDGRRPARMSDDETIVYDFTAELQDTKRVSDTTYALAEARFGKAGIVDLTAVSGYYTLLAMELNVARYSIPETGQRLPRLPE